MQKSKQAVAAAIAILDLDCIKIKLMDPEEGLGWTREEADDVAEKYKKFLYLSATSGTSIVPTGQIDKFWHQHILDTRKYAADCDAIFGYFLHHFPYLGMRGTEDAKELQRQFRKTQELYMQEFGESCSGHVPTCNSPNCSECMGCVTVNGNDTIPALLAERPSFKSHPAA